eukprot:CAMPEP_0170462126 /NCGR_PEP_ID=MMETSP0123-20130129/7752_1 /TAXON_ID=182087 /ORGANISM="Favella ehrenbergii, Strain Fehren 1" /LENGTH=72 /DNA_ID=CAMNT_0010727275 /DNA_START=43 /DNA_END=261 /DNA_ORIENTATION=-
MPQNKSTFINTKQAAACTAALPLQAKGAAALPTIIEESAFAACVAEEAKEPEVPKTAAQLAIERINLVQKNC